MEAGVPIASGNSERMRSIEALVRDAAHASDGFDRAAAFDKLWKLCEERQEGAHRDAVAALKAEVGSESDGRRRIGRVYTFRKHVQRGKRRDTKPAVRRVLLNGQVDYQELRNNIYEIRQFVKHESEREGYTFDELWAPLAPHRPPASERARYEAQAKVVRRAVDRGAKQAALGSVVRRSKQRISELSRHGEQLEREALTRTFRAA